MGGENQVREAGRSSSSTHCHENGRAGLDHEIFKKQSQCLLAWSGVLKALGGADEEDGEVTHCPFGQTPWLLDGCASSEWVCKMATAAAACS